MTESRRVILEELKMNDSHPTADEVYSRVRERLPRVSLGTVYRNLDYLAKHGLVSTLRDIEGRRRYDVADEEHCHIWCVECGRVQDLRLIPEASIEGLIESDEGYEVTGHRIRFLGLCPWCRSRADGDSG